MTSIASTLALAAAAGLQRLDAQLLLLHAMGTAPADTATRRAWLLAHDEEQVPAAAATQFEHFVRRRVAGEPLGYITGHKEFFGLDLRVDRRVLVPRPDTELLVAWVLEVMTESRPQEQVPRLRAVLDLGTGSGAIALAVKHARPDLQVDAVDASADALEVARANALDLGLVIRLSQGSWLAANTARYHCIVANPPYVAAGDSHLAALEHEPVQALVAGEDGLDDIRAIIGTAAAHLHQDGWLLLEHGFEQAPDVRKLFAASGYRQITSRRDLGGHERCTGGMVIGHDTAPMVK